MLEFRRQRGNGAIEVSYESRNVSFISDIHVGFLFRVISLKPWPNGLASQCKFAKPELAYGLAKCGQTNSQVSSQVAKSRKFHAYHWLMRFYNNKLLAINLCRLALGGQTLKNLSRRASKFELDQSPRKSSQVNASGRPNETHVELKSKTCVDLRVRLARVYCFADVAVADSPAVGTQSLFPCPPVQKAQFKRWNFRAPNSVRISSNGSRSFEFRTWRVRRLNWASATKRHCHFLTWFS